MVGFLQSCVLFFFKQETAYEMRISDWSSDVCSSDLRRGDGYDDVQGPALHDEPEAEREHEGDDVGDDAEPHARKPGLPEVRAGDRSGGERRHADGRRDHRQHAHVEAEEVSGQAVYAE